MNHLYLHYGMSLRTRHLLAAIFMAVSTLCTAQPTGNFTRLRTYTSARDGNMKGVAHGNFSQIRANIGHYRRR